MRFYVLATVNGVSVVCVTRRIGDFFFSSVFVGHSTRVVHGVVFTVERDTNATGTARGNANFAFSANFCFIAVG